MQILENFTQTFKIFADFHKFCAVFEWIYWPQAVGFHNTQLCHQRRENLFLPVNSKASKMVCWVVPTFMNLEIDARLQPSWSGLLQRRP
jgi:hypothetical protein